MGDLKGSHEVDLKLLDIFNDFPFCFEMCIRKECISFTGRAGRFLGDLLLNSVEDVLGMNWDRIDESWLLKFFSKIKRIINFNSPNDFQQGQG